MHEYIHIYICISTFMYTYMYTSTYLYIHRYIHISINMSAYTDIQTWIQHDTHDGNALPSQFRSSQSSSRFRPSNSVTCSYSAQQLCHLLICTYTSTCLYARTPDATLIHAYTHTHRLQSSTVLVVVLIRTYTRRHAHTCTHACT